MVGFAPLVSMISGSAESYNPLRRYASCFYHWTLANIVGLVDDRRLTLESILYSLALS
jgi:hypothetical protein